MNPDAKSLTISSPMALRFSSLKRCKHSLTGLEPSLTFKVWWVTSLGMPDVSEGFHAKMSLLKRRKSTSALSYLGESVMPICTVLSPELSGSMRITLMASAGSKDPMFRLESSVSSMVFSRMTARFLEAMTVEVSSQLSTSH
jgi:hypothetical protein